jgi:hypothetical protein
MSIAISKKCYGMNICMELDSTSLLASVVKETKWFAAACIRHWLTDELCPMCRDPKKVHKQTMTHPSHWRSNLKVNRLYKVSKAILGEDQPRSRVAVLADRHWQGRWHVLSMNKVEAHEQYIARRST